MSTLSRKQRELQAREQAILRAARRLLLERGYHGLTMERIAEAIEYSKGTVYQHFHCKEEVISTVAKQSLEEQVAMEMRALHFPGRPRERMVAIGEAVRLFTLLHTEEVRILQIIQTQAIREKSSEAIQEAMKAIEFRNQKLLASVIQEAVAQGDLVLSGGTRPAEMAFTLWSIVVGGYVTIIREIPLSELHIDNPVDVIMHACDVLGDGYGWRPLSTEWDYEATRHEVRRTLFPEETRCVLGN